MPPTAGHTPLSRCLQRICLRARMRPQSFLGCFACRVAVYIRAGNKRLLRCFRRRKKPAPFALTCRPLVNQREYSFSAKVSLVVSVLLSPIGTNGCWGSLEIRGPKDTWESCICDRKSEVRRALEGVTLGCSIQ